MKEIIPLQKIFKIFKYKIFKQNNCHIFKHISVVIFFFKIDPHGRAHVLTMYDVRYQIGAKPIVSSVGNSQF